MKEGQSHIYCATGKSLISVFLNFIRGTVDSENSPQNISRETVQLNKILRMNKLNLVKECLEMSAGVNEKNDEHMKFHEQIAENVKGTMDSDVHDLNDSREIARQNMILRVIKMYLVKKCLVISTGINVKNDEYKKFDEQTVECWKSGIHEIFADGQDITEKERYLA